MAHSQGNFYANSAGELLGDTAKGHYVVMGVAVPTSKIFADGPYLTLVQDKVMAAVRLFRGALPANVSSDSPSPSGHEFITQYLDGKTTWRVFEEELESILWNENSADIYEPSYIDESLRPFWRYTLNVVFDPHRVLKPYECLAILSFAKLYRLEKEPCEKRSLQALVDIMNRCRTSGWKGREVHGFWSNNCALRSIEEFDEDGGALTEIIEGEHEECFGAFRGKIENLIEPNFDAAVDLLKHPPAREIGH